MQDSDDNKLNQQVNQEKNHEQNLSRVYSQGLSRNLKIILLTLLILFLVLGAIGVFGYYIYANNNVSKTVQPTIINKQNESETNVIETKEIITKQQTANLPVVIYAEEIKTTEDASRSWPTFRIQKKVQDKEPEILAEVGTVGEFPDNFYLSPDNKSLLVNLKNKIQILNLETKELTDLFIPKLMVSSVVFSPDSKQLFIWDQDFYGVTDQSRNYYLHLFNLEDKTSEVIKQGTSDSLLIGSVWRDDNIVIMMEGLGDFSTPWYFDLASKEMVKTPGNLLSDLISPSGKVMAVAVPKDSVDDVCNDFSRSALSVYNISDPISGNKLVTIGGEGNRVSVLAFSSDDKEVLYKAEKPWTNQADCNRKPERNYFKVEISSGVATKLSNLDDVLKDWNVNYVGAMTEYNYADDDEKIWFNAILLNDQPIVTSDKGLRIIGQYYN